jgi:phenylacetate-CoA ligase
LAEILWKAQSKLSVEYLKGLQLKLLQDQIRKVYNNSRFYRSKFEKAEIKPSDVQSLKDITRIPFTTREELELNFQDVLGVPYSKVATIRLTSGTTGHPLKVAHTKNDVDLISDASARRLVYHGVTSRDVVQITSAYGLSQGAWSMHWGAEKIGACIIPIGPAETERQILMIQQFRTTVLYAATNYHLRILEVANSLGQDLRKSSLKIAYCVSEKPTKNQIATLKKECGYEKVISDYGATEFPGFSVNCVIDEGSHHVWADYYLVETVDPETHEALGEGEKGELVITSLQREAFPLIRYLSKDLTEYFGFEKCECGLLHPKISADIDRKDYMTKIRGVTVFPSHVEYLLGKFTELSGRAQIVVDKRTPRHETTLRVEVACSLSPSSERALKEKIINEIKNRVGLNFNEVDLIPSGHFENKYPKVIIET